MGVYALAGTRSQAQTTWVLSDGEGHTIEEGTVITLDDVPFTVVADVVVAPGSFGTATGEVIVQSTELSDAANGRGTVVEVIDSLAWVAEVEAVGVSEGGVDPETEDDYLDRLKTELELLTPRPILPEDFAVLAQKVAGVERAIAIDLTNPGVNETQTISKTGTPTAGTFTLTYSGQTTTALNWNATAAQVQAALRALSNIGPEDVVVTGGPLPGTNMIVEFTNLLSSTNVATITVTDSVTGGDVTVTATTAGVAATGSNERMVTVAAVDNDGEPVTDATLQEVEDYLDSLREVNFIVHTTDPTYNLVDVSVTVTRYEDYDANAVQAAVTAIIQDYLSPAKWGDGVRSTSGWTHSPKVHRLTLAAAIRDSHFGVFAIDSLTINGSATDLTLTGVAPLTRPGTIAVTVSN